MFVCFHQYLITIFNQLGCNVHVRLLLLKTKSSKIASWPGFLASGKDSRTKVVLARKIEKQGLGSTPDPNLVWPRTLVFAWELSQEEWMSVTFHILLPHRGQRWRWARQKSQSKVHNIHQFLIGLGSSSWSTRFSQPQCCRWRGDTSIVVKILKSVTSIILKMTS